MSAVSIHQAIEAGSPCIAVIGNEQPIVAKAILSKLVTGLVGYFNVGKTMNDAQIVETVNMLTTDFVTKNLTPEDYHVCFSRMKTGHYGKAYDRIDGQVIFMALHEYANEKMDVVESNSIKKAAEIRKNEKQEYPSHEWFKLLKSSVKEAKENMPKKEPVKREATKEDALITKWLGEFDEIFLSNPYGDVKRSKLILVDGKPMDQDTYLMYKYSQYSKDRDES